MALAPATNIERKVNTKNPFETLPVEIVESITHSLDHVDFFSLRLVCRLLGEKLAPLLARSRFTNLETNLTPKSLQRLQGIAEVDHFREYPRSLTICDRVDENVVENLGQGFFWPRNDTKRLQSLSNLPCVQTLQSLLLTRFARCRSFRICKRATEELAREDRIGPSDAVNIILHIVTEAGLPIQSFWTDFHGHRIYAERLNMDIFHTQKFDTAWSGIQNLDLEHSIMVTVNTFSVTMDLLTCATSSLRSLSLRLGIFDWGTFLSQYVNLGHFPPGLENFRLTSSHVTSDVLLQLLLPSAECLKELDLSHVYLASDGYSYVNLLDDFRRRFPHLRRVGIERPRERDFSTPGKRTCLFFPALAKLPLVASAAESIKAKDTNHRTTYHGFPGTCQASSSENGYQDGTFRLTYRRHRGQLLVSGVRYHGTSMNDALELIAKSIEYIQGI